MKFLAVFSVFMIFTSVAQAELFRGPISSALGGAGVAGIPASEGAFLNPALVPVLKDSGFDAYYRDGYIDRGQHRTAFGLGAIDNSGDSWMPGSLHYIRTRDTGRFDRPVNGELWHAAIGQQIGQFALGISGYRIQYDVPEDRRYTQWNYSVGGVYMFSTAIGVGYVLKNIAKPGSEIPMGLREDMSQTLGVLAGFSEFARARFDILRQERFNPDHKMAYMMGLETKTDELLVFRIGYRYDDLTVQRTWTAGLGFDGPKLKADYTFEKSQDRTSGALHSVDLRMPF